MEWKFRFQWRFPLPCSLGMNFGTSSSKSSYFSRRAESIEHLFETLVEGFQSYWWEHYHNVVRPEILLIFTIISPSSSYLLEVLKAVTKMPTSDENNFICLAESNFLIIVCLHFPHLSQFSSYSHENSSAATEAPLAKKAFSMLSSLGAPNLDFLLVVCWNCCLSPLSSYLHMFDSTATPLAEKKMSMKGLTQIYYW